MPALGERFRAAREARGLTLSDVSEQLRIRAVYLAAIEEENWPAIGAAVYARGFLRTYARFLGLDPEESVAAFNASSGAAAPASTAPVATPGDGPRPIAGPRQGLSPVIWIASAIAIALVAYVVYNAMTLSRPGTSAIDASASAVASSSPLPSNSPGPGATDIAAAGASASPTVSASPGGPNSLELHFSSASWLRVSVDGGASIEGTFPAGTVKTFHGKFAIVRVGNAAGVEAFVDGKSVGVLGKAGDVVDRTFTL
jgi:cytoskeleton protein RodZ